MERVINWTRAFASLPAERLFKLTVSHATYRPGGVKRISNRLTERFQVTLSM